jgi:hypothetical protein
MPQLQLDDTAPWKQRFRAPAVYWTQIAADCPTRGMAVSDKEAGIFQLYAWDTASGQLRRLMEQAETKMDGWLSPDGQHVYYLQDQKGDELGHITRVPHQGGEPQDMTPDLPPYTLRGLDISRAGNLLAFNPVNSDGFQLYVIALGPEGQASAPRLVYRSEFETWESKLSHGGELAAMQSTQRAGGARRYSTLAFDVASGQQIGELWDGPEHSVEPLGFAPLPGDTRLLASAVSHH